MHSLWTLWQRLRSLNIPVYSANACFFLTLAAVPALSLLTRLPGLDPENLNRFLAPLLPDPFRQTAQRFLAYLGSRSSGALGISGFALLWSAGRGMQGIVTGLNAVCQTPGNAGYLRRRFLSTVYMLLFLAVLAVTFGVQVFLEGLLRDMNFRFLLLPLLQVPVFCLMYTALPNRRSPFRDSLPGALFSAWGWLVLSRVFSYYVTHFSSAHRLYGPLSTPVLGMLWLYFSLCLFFCGGALNAFLKKDP